MKQYVGDFITLLPAKNAEVANRCTARASAEERAWKNLASLYGKNTQLFAERNNDTSFQAHLFTKALH